MECQLEAAGRSGAPKLGERHSHHAPNLVHHEGLAQHLQPHPLLPLRRGKHPTASGLAIESVS